ncbi:MAG: hypothetical protein HC850_00860 [Rhodomicrobium sp.]|nr:hypothetical protein [Rhodomicrobium sp.]
MTKKSQNESSAPEGDPERGDAILRRMLKSKPKPHKDMKKKKANERQRDHRKADPERHG